MSSAEVRLASIERDRDVHGRKLRTVSVDDSFLWAAPQGWKSTKPAVVVCWPMINRVMSMSGLPSPK